MKKQAFVKIIRSSGQIMAYGLILLVSLVICGCGSDSSKQSTQQVPDRAKPVIDKEKGSPKIVEIPQGKEPLSDKTVKEEGRTTKLPATRLLDEEVFPPSAPGEKGITRRELENMKSTSQPKTDPMDEVEFPSNPGEKPITRRDIENLMKQPQIQTDPMDAEVFPPTKPGEKGMTGRELERLKALAPQNPPRPLDPLPIPVNPVSRGNR
jgi:hypothetical protein